jgi:hypothetical protein
MIFVIGFLVFVFNILFRLFGFGAVFNRENYVWCVGVGGSNGGGGVIG